MAQQSYRFNPIFQAGRYWRLDVSWRTHDADPRHFIDEWTGEIPQQPAGQVTLFTVPSFKILPRDENELLAVDRVEIKIKMDAVIAALVNPANVSAELRLWWTRTPDAPATWVPRFWGVVDLDDVDPDTRAIVGGVWHKTVTIMAYDGLSALGKARFNDQSKMDTEGYHRFAHDDVYLGPAMMGLVMGRYNNMTWNVQPKKDGYAQLIHCKYYLEELAKVCFAEREEATALPLAQYGPDKDNPVTSPIQFRAFTNYVWPYSYVETGFESLYFWYDLFAAEWKAEFSSWGEFLAELAEMLGFVVTTKHYLEDGRWVRVLCYMRVDGDNDLEVAPTGVLLQKTGPRSRRGGRKVVVTTRTPSGAKYPIFDAYHGAGPEKKLTVHWRTVGHRGDAVDNNLNDDQTMNDLNGWQKENIMWGTMVIEVTPEQLQIVNQVRWKNVIRPLYETSSQLWAPYNLASYFAIQPNPNGFHGLSGVLSVFYAEEIFSPGRAIIEDTWSRLEGSDGESEDVGNWIPYCLTTDIERPDWPYKVTGIEMDSESGHIKIRKEELPLPNPFE
ncbi:MAG: hypothetical protein M5R41_10315 [Bacteroidia bacterium]|nr:hypothetical protein [Bacteroidia bacterium]